MIIYKFDVLQELKENGYNTNTLRKEKLLSEVTIQRLRDRKPISMESVNTICRLLEIQPGHMLRYVPDEK